MTASVELSPREYQILVEHAPTLIWRAGRDGKRDYFNRTWLRFTGRTLAQELGDGWVAGVHPEDVEQVVPRDELARQAAFEREYRLRRHDGEYRWLFDRGVPCVVDGQLLGFIGTCVDIEDRRRAEAARAEAQAREQEARRQADALAAELTAQCRAMEKTLRGLRKAREGDT